MAELPHFDMLNLCPDYRFVRVVSQEGVFYDVVQKWRARPHVFALRQTYFAAETVNRTTVPPCIFRDFTALDGSVRTCVWKNGTQFLFSPEPAPEHELGDSL